MKKLHYAKRQAISLFLSSILLMGTMTTFFPSFIIGSIAQAESYYDVMNYEKEYGYDKPYEKPKYSSYKPDYNYYKSKDSSISIEKVDCNNVNINFNDVSVYNVGRPPAGDFTTLDASSSETENQEGITTANNFADGEKPNNGFMKDKDGFVYVCVNYNNNKQEKPEPTMGSLNVAKQITCGPFPTAPPEGAPSPALCDELLALITPDQFLFQVEGNNPDPSSQFPGSPTGTDVRWVQVTM